MAVHRISRHFDTSDATAEAAAALGRMLTAGDTVLLSGPVGAGKTHFARHLIRALLITPEDIPSPTFTLVQTYDTRLGPVWHADLYRIATVDEIEELGLGEAFETAICLVEWPDRLGELRPDDALDIWLGDGGSEDSRTLTAHWDDPRWTDKMRAWAA
ncbi:MAG: tRNA (adenosine(37)-N6)-threonylcarbamoyltransferase complex ATPase subunit type 1 TsaE [Pseudomonadota bacterium]